MSTREAPDYGPPAVTESAAQHPATVRRPIPALVAVIAIAGAFVLLELIQVLVGTTYSLATSQFRDGIGATISVTVQATAQSLPVAVVVLVVGFLFFWGIAPIHGALRVGQVVARAILCGIVVGVVTGATFFVQFLILVAASESHLGPLSLHDLLRNITQSGGGAVEYFAQTIELIVLGAVLLWNWCRTHPADTTKMDPVGTDQQSVHAA